MDSSQKSESLLDVLFGLYLSWRARPVAQITVMSKTQTIAAGGSIDWSIAQEPTARGEGAGDQCGQIVEIMTTAPGDGKPAVWNALSAVYDAIKLRWRLRGAFTS